MTTPARRAPLGTPASTPVKKISVQVLNQSGIIPQKASDDSPGYDMHLVGRKDGRHEDSNYAVNEFTTGIAIQPPSGYYIEIIGMNSLFMQGYNIVGGVYTVDPSHSSELVIPLMKFREVADIQLPCKCLQMILREIIPSHVEKVSSIHIHSDQPTGGFTSTSSYSSSYPASQSGSAQKSSKGGYYAPTPEPSPAPAPASSSERRGGRTKASNHLW